MFSGYRFKCVCVLIHIHQQVQQKDKSCNVEAWHLAERIVCD